MRESLISYENKVLVDIILSKSLIDIRFDLFPGTAMPTFFPIPGTIQSLEMEMHFQMQMLCCEMISYCTIYSLDT